MKLEDASRVISAAEKKASEISQPMNIGVTDEGGNIIAAVRMEGIPLKHDGKDQSRAMKAPHKATATQ